jgi:hypothetical protein
MIARLCVALLALSPASLYAKEVGAFAAPDKSFTLQVETAPGPKNPDGAQGLELNKMTALIVKVVPKSPEPIVPGTYTGLEFDATMPAHNHGMVVKPVVTETAPGEFRIDGVKLHMAGDWLLQFTLKASGQPVKVTAPLQLK